MKKLTARSLVLAVTLSCGATSAMAGSFEDKDMAFAFEQEGAMEVATLSEQEMRETEGAWVQWAVFGALGGTMNTVGYIGSNKNWTYGGAAYSFLTGAAGGLMGGLPGKAAYRAGYGAVGAYTASQPYGGYSWSRW